MVSFEALQILFFYTGCAYLWKSTQDYSMGRYSILHFLLYHGFNFKEIKENTCSQNQLTSKRALHATNQKATLSCLCCLVMTWLYILFSEALLIPLSSSTASGLNPWMLNLHMRGKKWKVNVTTTLTTNDVVALWHLPRRHRHTHVQRHRHGRTAIIEQK